MNTYDTWRWHLGNKRTMRGSVVLLWVFPEGSGKAVTLAFQT